MNLFTEFFNHSCIKNVLRSSMDKEQLNDFTMFSIEHEILNHEIIDDFTDAKNRKKVISVV